MQKPLSEEEVDELISDLLGVESKVFNLFFSFNGDLLIGQLNFQF